MEKRQLPEDFKEFLSLLNKNKVKYLLLGGWAVGIYAAPRATADMDVFISVEDENLKKLLKALNEFGAISVPKEHFKEPGRIFRMGRSPIRIEIINQASGISFNSCYKRSNKVNVDGIEITVISPNDLLINKQASGREKDIADLKSLEKILRKDK
jgi:predicted nucleotidyltransferase